VLVVLGAEEVVGTPSAVTLVPLVEGAVGVGAGTGAVVVDDELDDVTVVLGDELLALEVAGATGGDEADPPHAASTTGSAMIQRTFSLMLRTLPVASTPGSRLERGCCRLSVRASAKVVPGRSRRRAGLLTRMNYTGHARGHAASSVSGPTTR